MHYQSYFFRKLGKMSRNLSSAAVAIGASRVRGTALVFTFVSMQKSEVFSSADCHAVSVYHFDKMHILCKN